MTSTARNARPSSRAQREAKKSRASNGRDPSATYPFSSLVLKNYRFRKNYSLRKMAELIGGVSYSTVFRAEDGIHIGARLAFRIGKFLAEASGGE